jgi:hypothetical protein
LWRPQRFGGESFLHLPESHCFKASKPQGTSAAPSAASTESPKRATRPRRAGSIAISPGACRAEPIRSGRHGLQGGRGWRRDNEPCVLDACRRSHARAPGTPAGGDNLSLSASPPIRGRVGCSAEARRSVAARGQAFPFRRHSTLIPLIARAQLLCVTPASIFAGTARRVRSSLAGSPTAPKARGDQLLPVCRNNPLPFGHWYPTFAW